MFAVASFRRTSCRLVDQNRTELSPLRIVVTELKIPRRVSHSPNILCIIIIIIIIILVLYFAFSHCKLYLSEQWSTQFSLFTNVVVSVCHTCACASVWLRCTPKSYSFLIVSSKPKFLSSPIQHWILIPAAAIRFDWNHTARSAKLGKSAYGWCVHETLSRTPFRLCMVRVKRPIVDVKLFCRTIPYSIRDAPTTVSAFINIECCRICSTPSRLEMSSNLFWYTERYWYTHSSRLSPKRISGAKKKKHIFSRSVVLITIYAEIFFLLFL